MPVHLCTTFASHRMSTIPLVCHFCITQDVYRSFVCHYCITQYVYHSTCLPLLHHTVCLPFHLSAATASQPHRMSINPLLCHFCIKQDVYFVYMLIFHSHLDLTDAYQTIRHPHLVGICIKICSILLHSPFKFKPGRSVST
jgi:hypothetical protein